MTPMSTNRAQPAVMAMTLKNPRALRAAATSRIGRTCSDIRCLSCFTDGSQRPLVVVVFMPEAVVAVAVTVVVATTAVLVVVANHPPPHVGGEESEDPPLKGICQVAPGQPAAHQDWRGHPLHGRGRQRRHIRLLGSGKDEAVVKGAGPAVDQQGQVQDGNLPDRKGGGSTGTLGCG